MAKKSVFELVEKEEEVIAYFVDQDVAEQWAGNASKRKTKTFEKVVADFGGPIRWINLVLHFLFASVKPGGSILVASALAEKATYKVPADFRLAKEQEEGYMVFVRKE